MLSVPARGRRFGREVREAFVALVLEGVGVRAAARAVGASSRSGPSWWRQSGGMELNHGNAGSGIADPAAEDAGVGTRYLTLLERKTIELRRGDGWSFAQIGAAIGRDRSVVWREVRRASRPDGVYRAALAHHQAHQLRRRSKTPKLAGAPELAWFVTEAMDAGWSPKLISVALADLFPDDGGMRISHESIYRALYVQTRGVLRADLAKQLSTHRTARKRAGSTRSVSPYRSAFTIADRPAEVQDRAVPGHWEGDLIVGAGSRSAIGTLVERTTRYTILLHLPGDHTADTVATAMIAAMKDLPQQLRGSITWDRGTELADYRRITNELDTPVFFCNPHSPWQRGTNENTNRLLRHWFEKGSDLSRWTPADLARVASALNHRPRPTLTMRTPITAFTELLEHAAAA